MREQSVEKQVSEELTNYFERARQVKCPPGMKKKLYERIGIKKKMSWWQPVMAFSLLAVCSLSLVWQHQNQKSQIAQAERDMQIAMYYMQKISEKTLDETNTHGIVPAIIVPVSKSMAQI